MQAYKGLYEDQLQTQHASAESYRSLTRGYSRLSADNKALRRETATVAAVAAAAGDAAGNAAALIASSTEMQRISTRARSGRKEKERREQAQGSSLGGSAVEVDGGAAARSAGNAVTPVDDDSVDGVTTRAHTVTAAESASAVATAASAVAAAAGALAEATTSALPADDQGSAAPISPSIEKEEGESAGVGAIAAASDRDGWKRSFERSGSGGGKDSSRDLVAASSHGSTGTERPSTAETIACSPYSEKADTPPSTAMRELVTATAGKSCGTADTEAGGAAFADGQAPPADCSLARQKAMSRNSTRANGDGDGGGDGGGGGARTTKSYAFQQTTGDEIEDFSFSTGIHTSSPAAAAAAAPAAAGSTKPQHGNPRTIRGRGTSTHKPDKPSGTRATCRSEPEAPRLTKAVPLPPVEPAPRWRGRSAGPGRLLATSASWAENVDVEAPKRSSSPVPPRRGRWGDCPSAWGGGDGGARGDGCSRIEPSSRVRPHSI